jgi:uncharacterized membrane protein YeiH
VAQKALAYGHNGEVAVLLGITTAVGGGYCGMFCSTEYRFILEKEIYASAALVGAVIVVLGNDLKWMTSDWASIIGLITCFTLRILALHYHWNVPASSNSKRSDK